MPIANPAEFVGGAGLGTVFSILVTGVRELISKNTIFKPLFKSIESKLIALDSLFPEIEEYNRQLSNPGMELKELEKLRKEGEKLVSKCKKVSEGKWNPFKKYYFAIKLMGWKDSLTEQLEILKLHVLRDGKKTAVTVQMTAISVDSMQVSIRNIEHRMVLNQSAASSSHDRTTPLLELPPLPRHIVGLDHPLMELKGTLLSDGVSRLVLTAPGGCGKTTLATMFCQDKKVEDKFGNNIFFITVSQKGNLDLIVQRLCEYKGRVPTFLNNEVYALQLLHTILKEEHNPILLVLDDVWSRSILDKFKQFKTSNFKILVTSRSEFPGFGSSYNLRILNDENAMDLFRHTASLEDRSSPIPEDILKKIVEHCKGFPLAITVVGRSLAGQPIQMWQNRLIEWSKGLSILDSETELLLCLQSSLDALHEELKECFLDLGSFPEDKQIPVSALIDMWVESYDLDEDIQCFTKLHELSNRSLANLVDTRKKKMEGEGYFNEHFVTQHDLLRELTIYHSKLHDVEDRKRLIIDMCGDNLPKWWRKQKHQRLKARLLSISTDGNFTTWPDIQQDIQLPDAEVLVLNFQTKKYALPQFVGKMNELKVLVVTNDGFLRAELSNFHLLGLLSNLKRIRLERISSIPSIITMNSTQLNSLQKISLCNCNIRHAFGNGSVKMLDAFPNLLEMNIDNDLGELPAEICDLVHLRKLCITNCFWLSVLPGRIGNLVNLEELRLRSCTELKAFPDTLKKLKKLNFLDLSGSFSIHNLPKDIGEMSSLRKLDIRYCRRFEDLPPSILDLKQLEEVICCEVTKRLCGCFHSSRKNIRIVVAQ